MATPQYMVNSTFDPWSQAFTIKAPDGVTPIVAHIADILLIQQSAVYQSICQGTQTGAALILLITLILITKTDKRRSVVFLLNAMALTFVVLRGILSLLVLTGPFYDFYRWELLYYTHIGNAKSISAAAEVMTFFLALTIELSLIFQVRIVCCNLEPFKRHTINIFNMLVAFSAVAIRFALMVMNIDWNIAHVETETEWQFQQMSRFASATNITFVMSVAISAAIFCAKLGFAIEARQSMGMKQFGPMQIIFVMGCQTMCTPLIFTIIAYWVIKNAQVGSFVPTVVAISLPLSAMWAAVNTKNAQTARAGDRAFPVGGPGLASGKAYGYSKEHLDSMNTNDTLVDDDSSAALTLRQKDARRFDMEERDLEMQKLGEGHVQVDRTYSVRTD